MSGFSPFADDNLDLFWEDLLARIEEGRVIPVIGPELLQVEADGRIQPLQPLLARLVAAQLGIEVGATNLDFGYNDLIVRARRGSSPHTHIKRQLDRLAFNPPESMRQLASIDGFRLFINLSFDDLLVRAIDSVRHAGEKRTLHIGYAPNKRRADADLPCDAGLLPTPTVYALFGLATAAREYVLGDEDLLEFITGLQTPDNRPERLFAAVQGHHLLFLGCAYPDWLTRIFLRLTKQRRLSEASGNDASETLVSTGLQSQPALVSFLENYSPATRCFPSDTETFISELSRRWQALHDSRQASTNTGAAPFHAQADVTLPDDLPAGGIFISYSSTTDLSAAEHLASQIRTMQLDVWLDKERLEAGDLYDQKIRRNISSCALFIAVLSRAALARSEGYFRREWKLAERRVEQMADHIPFVLPVVIDDLPSYTCNLPDFLTRPQWIAAPGGKIPDGLGERLRKLVRDYHLRRQNNAS